MYARAVVACACAALAVHLTIVCAQDSFVNVLVKDREHDSEQEDIEKRMTSELVRELNTAKSDALLLYTEYTAKAGADMKDFMKNISTYANEALRAVEKRPIDGDGSHCRNSFESRLKKIEVDAYRAAGFSGENHHKFLLGHMVVFRMHLNKTEEYIRKCERALYGCVGASCENTPIVKRWKRHALYEINRVKDDLQHTRRSYKDIVTHAKRRLNHIKKQIHMNTADAVEDYHKCLDGSDSFRYHMQLN